MEFVKLESDIPSCCRLALVPPDLDAEAHIAQLPNQTDNADLANPRRHKWILFSPKHEVSPVYERWPELQRFIDDFPGKCLFAQVSMMEPGARLGIHRDGYAPDGELMKNFKLFNSTLRFHIPLRTSANVHIYSDGQLYHMAEGELWMLNNMKTHSVVNDDPEIQRYHLIFDVRPNEDTMALIEAADPDLGVGDRATVERIWPREAA